MKRRDDNDDSFFGGFEAVVDGLARIDRVKPSKSEDPDDGFETITEINEAANELPLTDPEEITGVPEVKETKKVKKEDKHGMQKQIDEEEIVEEDEEEIEEEVKETKSVPATSKNSEEISDLGEYEQDVVDFFVDKFNSELGWNSDSETKPKSVSEVIDYIKDIVETSSQPQYANEEIKKMNDFVANGGDIKNYYNEVYGSTDLELADIENENIQKKILKENFTRLGYSEDKVKKYINRYEEAGTLQEEAEDALEDLKQYKRERAERLLVEQENMRKEQQKAQQKFYTDVYNSIQTTDSILGIPITSKEKKELHDYIFKPEADGFTKYQKDYAKDNKNLIESAYITMKGNTLIQKVTQKATSQAAKNLQDKLANKGKRVKNSSTTHGDRSDTLGAWNTVSRQLRRPNF